MQCQRPPTGGRCARRQHGNSHPTTAMLKSASNVRFAIVGDIHVTKDSAGTLRAFFAQAAEAADALLLCGDLTDYGTAEEAHVLADELAAVKVPIVAILGNHDYESGTPEIVSETLKHAGVRVLDGEACEIEGVGIAGAKGFAGGFGRGSLGSWGEPAIKLFVKEALNEAMKLESALAKLRTPRRIALLHYSPISGTLAGEPPEIFPSWARAGWRSRCCATRWTPSSTVTHTAAHWRARPSTAYPSTTWPSRCCSAAGRSSLRFCCSSCRVRRESSRRPREWRK